MQNLNQLLPLVRLITLDQTAKDHQILILVDSYGRPSGGYAPRGKAHAYPGLKHLAVQVLVFDADNRIVLHQRNANKIGGKLWDSPTTHVLKDETVESAARRCLKDEYGIATLESLTVLGGFSYETPEDDEGRCENEYCLSLLCAYKGEIIPNGDETMGQLQRSSSARIFDDVTEMPSNYPFWFLRSIELLRSYEVG